MLTKIKICWIHRIITILNSFKLTQPAYTCLKLTEETIESVSIVNFEHVIASWEEKNRNKNLGHLKVPIRLKPYQYRYEIFLTVIS